MKSKLFGVTLLFVGLVIGTLVLTTLGEAAPKKTANKDKGSKKKSANSPVSAYRLSDTEIEIGLKFKNPDLTVSNFLLTEYGEKTALEIAAVKMDKKGKIARIVSAQKLSMSKNYQVAVIDYDEKLEKVKTNIIEVQPSDDFLNQFYSEKELGAIIKDGKTTFRVFAPRAIQVILSLFDEPYTDSPGKEKQNGEKQIQMTQDKDGVWETTVNGELWGKYYGYRVTGPAGASEEFEPNTIVADPYSKAMATLEMSPQHHLTVIVNPDLYKWRSKNKYTGYKQEQYIVYEMHVRDLTMLSKNITKKGTYEGLIEDGKQGGLAHIKELGVNAIELLPVHDFNEIEVPYKVKDKNFPAYNTWNTYGRNHWGYMTANYFSPESFYLNGKIEPNKWIGASGNQVFSLMSLVDTMHLNGISVVLDVVYNHVSQYDKNALKKIDKKYYFWMTGHGTYDAHSGCGNDFKTSRPMSSRLVVDSTAYWVDTYHIDGYRFDLGTIIDWQTYEKIKEAVYKLNPNTFLVAEPWMGGRGEPLDGGGYSPQGMAKHGIGAWNDKVREDIKALALGNLSSSSMKNGVKAYPNIYREPKYSLNYVESHDNNTFGDYIRLNAGIYKHKDTFTLDNLVEKSTLSEKEIKMHKVAALFLMTIQGPVMIHEGQEFARMKIVVPPEGDSVFPINSAKWEKQGKKWVNTKQKDNKGNYVGWSQKAQPWVIDHDSYEKDNEANWINWAVKDANIELFNYYKGLIALRKKYSKSFGLYPVDKIKFIEATYQKDGTLKKLTQSALGYFYDKNVSGDPYSFVVLVNGNKSKDADFELPEGEWKVMVDAKSSIKPEETTYSGVVNVPKQTGMILYQ